MEVSVFFFKQKTAYDRRISDWSSYVCSSDLGNKSQNARQRALENFRNGRARVLVATDIAARGIDVDGITHVINYELPNVPESYVHRIGRTARAGASGIAYSFCDGSERPYLKSIERLTRRALTVYDTKDRKSTRLNSSH